MLLEKESDFAEVMVEVDGKILFTIQEEKLAQLRAVFPPGTRLMWEINEDGVIPVVAPE